MRLSRPGIVASLGRSATIDLPLAGEADLIELRLDLMEEPLEVVRSVRSATALPIIATNRMRSEGGAFQGSEPERIELLREASAYADILDIELRADLRQELMRSVDKPFIVSYHDFQGTPGPEGLKSILDEISGTGASIAKIAVAPASLKENLDLLKLLLESTMPLCIIAMGRMGRHLRAIAPIYGSVLTYGYVSQAIAPGQMSVGELRRALEMLDPGEA
jgi:3-dehydroquinate dehydratase-1